MSHPPIHSHRVAVAVSAAALTLAAGVGWASSGVASASLDEPPVLDGETIATFDTFDANQGIAVDDAAFYVVNNASITKHDKVSGDPLLQWVGDEDGPVIHLDSGVVVDGLLYAAHSNYSDWPITSSIEVFDTATMEHVDSFSFGIYRGSFTWLDRHDGYWWGAFANYNRVQDGDSQAYGLTANTQVVRMNDDFEVIDTWTYPIDLIESFDPMSNSGGSWGPDGRLYITGHDAAAVYVMELPDAGSVLKWVATVNLDSIEGQGIAWDRSLTDPALWGILRDTRQAIAMSIPLRPGVPLPADVGEINGPGEFDEDL